jgi:hypothetical protein
VVSWSARVPRKAAIFVVVVVVLFFGGRGNDTQMGEARLLTRPQTRHRRPPQTPRTTARARPTDSVRHPTTPHPQRHPTRMVLSPGISPLERAPTARLVATRVARRRELQLARHRVRNGADKRTRHLLRGKDRPRSRRPRRLIVLGARQPVAPLHRRRCQQLHDRRGPPAPHLKEERVDVHPVRLRPCVRPLDGGDVPRRVALCEAVYLSRPL